MGGLVSNEFFKIGNLDFFRVADFQWSTTDDKWELSLNLTTPTRPWTLKYNGVLHSPQISPVNAVNRVRRKYNV
jgi:hypothetical protein